MQFKRVAAILALVMGALGVIGCAAAAIYVGRASAKLDRANETLFATIDKGLGLVEKRVRAAQLRVRESKVTTDELSEKLEGWATKKAIDRVAAKFGVEQRTEKLTQQLRTVDLWIETASDSVQDFKQVLTLGSSLGAKLDQARTDTVLERLAEARVAVQRIAEAVNDVREFATGQSDGDAMARVTKLLARIVLTITEVDDRLGGEATRLTELRAESGDLKVKTENSIFWIVVGCYAALAWMALGQATLCRYGWKGVRRCGGSAVHAD